MGFLIVFLLITVFEPERFFGGDMVWDMLSLGALVAGCIYYFPLRFGRFYYTPILNIRGFLLFALFLLLLIISFWRTHSFLNSQITVFKSTTMVLLLPVLIYFIYQKKTQKGEGFEKAFLISIIHVLGIFCLANFIAFVVNPTFNNNETATTFSFLGITTKRAVYPLYPLVHPARIGSLGGFLVVLCFAYLKHLKIPRSKEKILLMVYISVGFIIILMSDSRANLFSTILCVIGIRFLATANKLSLLKHTVWLLPFSNVLFIGILTLTAGSTLMANLSRGSSNDIATGNSRLFIYMAANNELSDFKPIHVIGFGEYGPYGAGITKYYMEKKFGYTDKSQKLLASITHNTALQVIFDIGYIGLIVYLLLLYTMFSQMIKLYKEGKPTLLIIAYWLTYILINGTSGTFYGHYNAFQNCLFIILSFFIFISFNHSLKESKPKLTNVKASIQK